MSQDPQDTNARVLTDEELAEASGGVALPGLITGPVYGPQGPTPAGPFSGGGDAGGGGDFGGDC